MTMLKKILLTILIVTLLLTPASANSPLNAYMQNLTVAGSDYVSGKVSSDELLCKVVETEYLLNRDHSAIEFISSRDNSEIKDMYEVTLSEFDWEYGNENDVKREVRDYVWGTKQISIQLSVFYNLQGDKPIVIYLTIQEGREKKSINVDMYPAPYGRFTDEGFGYREQCLERYLKPMALNALENAQLAIASAKNSGVDTTGAEERLESSEDFFEKGEYTLSETYASWAINIVESSKKLSEYRSLSDEEKIKLIQEKFSGFSKEKMNRSEVVSEGTIKNHADIGSNLQFNLFLGSESNSIRSFTEVTDFDNKTITTYQNQLTGEYDLYIGIDALLMHELTLMDEANSSPFSFGKRLGIALVKGEIKIKPVWKLYKILSVLKAMGGAEEEFTKGMASEIS